MTPEHRILTWQRGVAARLLVSLKHALAGHPATPPADVHPMVHDAARRGMKRLRDDLRARIAVLDAEIEQVLSEALMAGMGIGTRPVMAGRRAAPGIS